MDTLSVPAQRLMSAYHEPVLLREVIAAFSPLNNKIIVDGTVGGAGHAHALAVGGAYVVGIDRDPDAIQESEKVLGPLGKDRYRLVHGSFADIGSITAGMNIPAVDGVLLDFGLSSHQLNDASRGFSYLRDGPLDMRFDRSGSATAGDIVSGYSQEELYEIISQYGEEKRARAICVAIVRSRAVKTIETTGELVGIIGTAIHGSDTTGVVSRVFQALRIAVNNELGTVRKGIHEAVGVLKTGGILAVITFHSLEDRIVKLDMSKRSDVMKVTKKPLSADKEEIRTNRRSRSAKLRIYKKI